MKRCIKKGLLWSGGIFLFLVLFCISLFLRIGSLSAQSQREAIIIDHTCRDIRRIPESAIIAAKNNLHIAYGHTSHGSQLVTGMDGLVSFMNGLGYPENLYAFNEGGIGGALDLRDQPFSGASDLGNPDFTAWVTATRNYLNDPANADVNVVIWSWCGQVGDAPDDVFYNMDDPNNDINYLKNMSQLEEEFPDVMFVYMTGHLDGTWADGTLNVRNEVIRNYCKANGKILYDFADIESYDPDGLTNYMLLGADDSCEYDSDNDGVRDRNWAVDWQSSHIEGVDWYLCDSAHSQPLNANLKAYAAWWLWARLAGWNENISTDITPTTTVTTSPTTTITTTTTIPPTTTATSPTMITTSSPTTTTTTNTTPADTTWIWAGVIFGAAVVLAIVALALKRRTLVDAVLGLISIRIFSRKRR
jgi:hypothetical protein